MTDIFLVSLYLPGLNYTYRSGAYQRIWGRLSNLRRLSLLRWFKDKISPGNAINVNSPYACIEAVVTSWLSACLNVYLVDAVDLKTRLRI
jgi:hypothetical protein